MVRKNVGLRLQQILPLLEVGTKMRVFFRSTDNRRLYSDGEVVMGKDAITGADELQFDYKFEDGVQSIDLETFIGFELLDDE